MKSKIVGIFDEEIIKLLNLNVKKGTPIILGSSNYQHMKSSHPDAFKNYFEYLEEIIANPDYVNLNPRDNSIKYIKKITEYVIVGVRVSINGVAFARTIYIFEQWKFEQY